MANEDYKKAYERQKLAREKADDLLESRSRELYEANSSLRKAFDKLKNQKEQIIHQEKLASIGQLAAGIAHEINNPAAYVKSNISSLRKYVKQIFSAIDAYNKLGDVSILSVNQKKIIEDEMTKIASENDLAYVLEDLNDLVNESIDGINRIEEIVKSLKEFSRPESSEPVEFNINTCIENTLKVIWNQIKYKCKVEKHFGEIPGVVGQSGSMGQVFMNLIVNASQAVNEGGIIKITTSLANKEIVIAIEDNGCGIKQENLNKLFDPFFSTKGVGEGTGLGLSISHGIIKKHGGRIVVCSEENIGTTFSVYLPANLES